jgi:hypothetical protein
MCALSEQQLEDRAQSFVPELVATFKSLAFLYELLSPQTMPNSIETSPIGAEQNGLRDEFNDTRKRIEAMVVTRLGQPAFREALIRSYQGRCAVTGCDFGDALQAAHLFPYNGQDSNHITNGVLLRADIHNLFDRHLMAIDPESKEVRIAPALHGTAYEMYDGKPAALPDDAHEAPHAKALEFRFACFVDGIIKLTDPQNGGSPESPRLRLFNREPESQESSRD